MFRGSEESSSSSSNERKHSPFLELPLNISKESKGENDCSEAAPHIEQVPLNKKSKNT